MTTERVKRIQHVLGIGTSVALLAAGAMLMAGCYGIYSSGDHAFSREAVAQAFAPIALPISLCIGVVALDILVNLLLPGSTETSKPEKQLSLILQRLHARTDLSKCSEELRSQIAAQQRSRRLHRTIRNALVLVCCVLFLPYGLNGENFHQSQINESMIQAMGLLIPCVTVPFAYGVFTAYQAKHSLDREIALLKSAPKEALRTPDVQSQVHANAKWPDILRWALLGAGACILVYGFFAGGTADVLTKAINICTECVGLG